MLYTFEYLQREAAAKKVCKKIYFIFPYDLNENFYREETRRYCFYKAYQGSEWLHAKHVDTAFCCATINRLEQLASLIGTKYACLMSQNDKVRVPIGLSAANKQSPLLMHVEYKISLVDHDWVVAARQKLIPSVVAGVVIQPDGFGRAEASGSGPRT